MLIFRLMVDWKNEMKNGSSIHKIVLYITTSLDFTSSCWNNLNLHFLLLWPLTKIFLVNVLVRKVSLDNILIRRKCHTSVERFIGSRDVGGADTFISQHICDFAWYFSGNIDAWSGKVTSDSPGGSALSDDVTSHLQRNLMSPTRHTRCNGH